MRLFRRALAFKTFLSDDLRWYKGDRVLRNLLVGSEFQQCREPLRSNSGSNLCLRTAWCWCESESRAKWKARINSFSREMNSRLEHHHEN
jgi:hypothetical protein